MTVTSSPPLPQLVNFGTYRNCGAKIGWVTVKPKNHRQPVDPEPRRLGPLALLRDGVHVVNLRDPEGPAGLERIDERYRGPRFWPHRYHCNVPSLKTIQASLLDQLDDLEERHRVAWERQQSAGSD